MHPGCRVEEIKMELAAGAGDTEEWILPYHKRVHIGKKEGNRSTTAVSVYSLAALAG